MRLLLVSLGVLILLRPMPALAHWADLAVADVVVEDSEARVMLTFPTGLVAWADDDSNGQLVPEEVARHRGDLEAFFLRQIRLSDGQMDGKLTIEPNQVALIRLNLKITPTSHTTLGLVYRWSAPIQRLRVHYNLFLSGVSTASCLTTFFARGKSTTTVFTPERRDFDLSFEETSLWRAVSSFVPLGVRHIWTGYDHVLFLLSLLMVAWTLRSLVKVVTAFTIAHSISLSLAVLDLLSLPPRFVESGVALSIAYVAGENLLRREIALRSRWVVTFGFGLIHGLGFASILKELALPRETLVPALVSFNLGVEIGQLAIVALAFLGLGLFRRRPWAVNFRRTVSAGAMVMGMAWFAQRAFFP